MQFRKFVFWFHDPPQYNYLFCVGVSVTWAAGMMWRHALCNPDITYRKQEMRKHQPDRERQHAYSLPYYNCQIRNIATKYQWIMCDNEPDWKDDCPSGLRPQRQQTHRLPLFGSIFNYYN